MLRVTSFCAAILIASPAFAGYAAIAYNKSSGQWGESHNFSTLGQAKAAALNYCSGHCFVPAWTRNAHLVLANDPSNPQVYGWAWNTSYRAAVNKALAECNSRSSEPCRVIAETSSF